MRVLLGVVCTVGLGLFIPEISPPAVAGTPGSIYLAGQPIAFDDLFRPQFTDRQIRGTSDATRAGLVKWGATPSGRTLLAHFNRPEYQITVTEEPLEEGLGRAPEPSLGTLVAARDHAAVKAYDLILNPTFRLPPSVNVYPSSQPATPDDWMAAAWAGEMLHLDFYSRGISLPHHQRSDFQAAWRIAAAQLGLPNMPHGDEESPRRRRIRSR